jgi:DNA-nicking Smr family endonuclease
MRSRRTKKCPTVSAEDADLFRSSIGPVKPLRYDRVPAAREPPAPVARFRWQDDRRVMQDLLAEPGDAADLETGEELIFARPGLQHRLLRRLRRGQFVTEAECDLHGMTVPVARQALTEFLRCCSLQHRYCVRIIHGKGHGSRQRIPVLKHKVNVWLRQREEVLAFCSARAVDGGTGAVYVLLRRSR